MRTSARACACTCSSEDDFRESVRTFPPAEARSLFFVRCAACSGLAGSLVSTFLLGADVVRLQMCVTALGFRCGWVPGMKPGWLELLPMSHLPSLTVLFLKAFVLGAMTLSWLCSCQQPPPNVLSTLTSGAQGTTIHS